MRRWLAIAAVALQVLALGYIAGEREWVLQTGRTVWLRTAPVDPRDVMRGDYVRLDYEIARVDRRLWQDGLTNVIQGDVELAPETRLYATLEVTPEGIAEVTTLSDRKPKKGLFLRGRFDPSLSWGGDLSIRYGLEGFFMEQGKAQELENQRPRAQSGVPLNMEVAVGANGIGVLKGYRWESLGIAITFDTTRRPNAQPDFPGAQNVVVGARVELKNHGPDPVAIVDLPEGRSFRLVAAGRWQEPAYRWVGETNVLPAPDPRDVIVLQPGQGHTNRVDLTQREWFVVDVRTNAKSRLPAPLQQLAPDWNSGFCIEYRPPPAEACERLPHAKLVWHGRLRSRWFNLLGAAD
jgi:uncharacterized membrane-anchored protein